MNRIEAGTVALQKEMKNFKEVMQQDRQQRDVEMKNFKEEMTQYRQQKDVEMKDFNERMVQDRKGMNKKWGDLANKLGTVYEDFAAPNIKTMAKVHFDCQELDSYALRVLRRNRNNRKQMTEFEAVI